MRFSDIVGKSKVGFWPKSCAKFITKSVKTFPKSLQNIEDVYSSIA